MRKILFCILLMSANTLSAATLETPNYLIQITSHCQEGHVDCNRVEYVGTAKHSGKRITLMGSTWHSRGNDGSPGRFLGYRFKNGNVSYLVTQEGSLSVIRDQAEILVEEQGRWQW